MDVSDPSSPLEVAFYDLDGAATALNVQDGLAYLTGEITGLTLFDVTVPSTPSVRSGHDPLSSAHDVHLAGNYAYTAGAGLRVIDLAAPSGPISVGSAPVSGPRLAISGDHLYFAGGDFHVFDISTPENPVEVGFFDTPQLPKDIAVRESLAYVADDRDLTILDISTAENPLLVAQWGPPDLQRILGVALQGKYAYLANGLRGLTILDVFDPANPVEVSSLDMGDKDALAVDVAGPFAYVADEDVLHVVFVADAATPREVASYDSLGEIRDVVVDGDLVYLAAGGAGLIVLDVSRPREPVEVAFYNTAGDATGIGLQDGLVYVADRQMGLSVIRLLPALTTGGSDQTESPVSALTAQEAEPELTISGPWPMSGHDRAHTGRTVLRGPELPLVKWQGSVLETPSNPVIGRDGTIYVGTATDVLMAFNPDGTVRWVLGADTDVTSTPAIGADGTIYFGTSATLFAARPGGTLKWSIHPIGVGGSPVVSPDNTIYVAGNDGTLSAVAADGTVKWTYQEESSSISTGAPAVGRDGTIYFATSYFLSAVNPDGTLKWEYPIVGGRSAALEERSQTIYVGGSNYVYALAGDGSVRWRFRPEATAFSAAIAADGTVHVGSNDNFLYALKSNGTLKWRFRTNGLVQSTPAVDRNGNIYFGSSESPAFIYALNPEGTLKWQSSPPDFPCAGFKSPAIGPDRTLYITGCGLWAIGPPGL